MIEPYFNNIRLAVLSAIRSAKKEILVAMCWFTNEEIFDALCEKLTEKIPITLIVLNDSINNRPDGLLFQRFIDLGGLFYFSDVEAPMHNKYCIIDSYTIMNGSYNWTYFAETKNFENITIIKNRKLASQFIADYKRLTKATKLIKIVKDEANADPQQPTIVEEARIASENDLIIKSRKELTNTNLKLKSSIGQKIHNDVYYPFLPKNPRIPVARTHTLTTIRDNQTTCSKDIRYGENKIGSKNEHIDTFFIDEIPPLKKGVAGFITTFSVDIYGLLTITIKIRETGKTTIQKFNIDHLLMEV